ETIGNETAHVKFVNRAGIVQIKAHRLRRMQLANQADRRVVERNDSAAAGMQEWRIGALEGFERHARQNSNRFQIRLEDSLDRKKSRHDAVLADRRERVSSVADGGEMMVLGRHVAVHAEGLAHFKR